MRLQVLLCSVSKHIRRQFGETRKQEIKITVSVRVGGVNERLITVCFVSDSEEMGASGSASIRVISLQIHVELPYKLSLAIRETNPIVLFTNTESWQCWHYCQICVDIHLQFPALLGQYDVSKSEIR